MDLREMQQRAALAKTGKPMPAKCEWCGRDVIHALHAGNKRRIPVNPEPHDAGTIRLVEDSGPVPLAEILAGKYRDAAVRAGTPLYMSHYYTCNGGGNAA